MMDRREYEAILKRVGAKEYILPVFGGVVKVKTDCEKQRVVFTVPHGWVSVIQGGGKEL